MGSTSSTGVHSFITWTNFQGQIINTILSGRLFIAVCFYLGVKSGARFLPCHIVSVPAGGGVGGGGGGGGHAIQEVHVRAGVVRH